MIENLLHYILDSILIIVYFLRSLLVFLKNIFLTLKLPFDFLISYYQGLNFNIEPKDFSTLNNFFLKLNEFLPISFLISVFLILVILWSIRKI